MQKEKEDAIVFHMSEELKQQLELEIKQLHSKWEAMEHMQGDEDSESKKKMAEQIQELEEHCDTLQSFAQTLVIKERNANDELQLARKALIYVSYLIDWSPVCPWDCIVLLLMV